MTATLNLENLVKRLRLAAKTGKPDGWTMLAVSEWADAAVAIEQQAERIQELERDNAWLKHEQLQIEGIHRRELEEARKESFIERQMDHMRLYVRKETPLNSPASRNDDMNKYPSINKPMPEKEA